MLSLTGSYNYYFCSDDVTFRYRHKGLLPQGQAYQAGLHFSLSESLNKEDDPELLKAVNYALKEYSCILYCLKDGSLDFSNNVCERQIRKIAKYRNNSFFVGSPESGVRYARLMSVFANIRNHNLDPKTYLCDVFRRIGKTAKEDLETLLAHLWTPQAVLNL